MREQKQRNDLIGHLFGGKTAHRLSSKLFSKSDFANHFATAGTVEDIRIYNRALVASRGSNS
jgi:hypothetical protein